MEENREFENNELENNDLEKKFNTRVIVHIILIALVVAFFAYIGIRLYRWNKGKVDDTDVSVINHEFDVEVMDYILPMDPKLLEGREDDGVTRIVFLGNNPLDKARWDDSSICRLVQKELTDSGEHAEVYNCSVGESLVASINETYANNVPIDAFGFYWVSAAIATSDYSNMDDAYSHMGYENTGMVETIDTLKNLDFETVDVIAIMYDGNDFRCDRPLDDGEDINIQYYTGAMEAGLQTIQAAYPHIRIMVLSPTYEYGVDETGQYINADLKKNYFGSLSTYVQKESDTCYENSVSYIDNYYGTVNEINAKEYLEDNQQLNEEGRKLVAKRFVECLNKYKNK
ncbi:hypothetical protein SAMN02910368_01903 [Lachnospiraceae bacterium G11]|nr:hypothetical protein SAMN02910368_01903 [Lachnospiraceae bacterium G11]